MLTTIAYYEYKVNGYVYDITRDRVDRITEILTMTQIIRHSEVRSPMTALIFGSGSCSTHYLIIEELRELYPYIGDNEEIVRLLYENR